MLDHLAASARAIVVRAQDEARALGHPAIGEDHLLLALSQDDGPAGEALRAAGATRDALAEQIPPGTLHTSGQVPFAPGARQVLQEAQRLAGGEEAAAQHVALALCGTRAWSLAGLDPEQLRDALAAEDPVAQAAAPAPGEAVPAPSPLPPEPWFRPPG